MSLIGEHERTFSMSVFFYRSSNIEYGYRILNFMIEYRILNVTAFLRGRGISKMLLVWTWIFSIRIKTYAFQQYHLLSIHGT